MLRLILHLKARKREREREGFTVPGCCCAEKGRFLRNVAQPSQQTNDGALVECDGFAHSIKVNALMSCNACSAAYANTQHVVDWPIHPQIKPSPPSSLSVKQLLQPQTVPQHSLSSVSWNGPSLLSPYLLSHSKKTNAINCHQNSNRMRNLASNVMCAFAICLPTGKDLRYGLPSKRYYPHRANGTHTTNRQPTKNGTHRSQ